MGHPVENTAILVIVTTHSTDFVILRLALLPRRRQGPGRSENECLQSRLQEREKGLSQKRFRMSTAGEPRKNSPSKMCETRHRKYCRISLMVRTPNGDEHIWWLFCQPEVKFVGRQVQIVTIVYTHDFMHFEVSRTSIISAGALHDNLHVRKRSRVPAARSTPSAGDSLCSVHNKSTYFSRSTQFGSPVLACF